VVDTDDETVMADLSVKRIRVYKNGDVSGSKQFVVSSKQIASHEKLLQVISSELALPEAARSLHTPRHGAVVHTFDQLEDKAQYVVVSRPPFKPLPYGRKCDDIQRVSRDIINGRSTLHIPVVERSTLRMSGRIHQSITDATTIFVYTNGEVSTPAKRIALTSQMMTSWQLILAEVNQHVHPQFSATRVLYTLDGELVRHKADVKTGRHYVAVGQRAAFSKLDYGTVNKPLFVVSRRVQHRDIVLGSRPVPRSRDHLSRSLSDMDNDELTALSPTRLNDTPRLRGQKMMEADVNRNKRANNIKSTKGSMRLYGQSPAQQAVHSTEQSQRQQPIQPHHNTTTHSQPMTSHSDAKVRPRRGQPQVTGTQNGHVTATGGRPSTDPLVGSEGNFRKHDRQPRMNDLV
jgi:hypothetical protein